jgi:hypothetical protein
MPTADHLQLDQTFEAQRDLVNRTIVPTVMEALDSVTYPVAETIIYDMIHNRHKHQREEHLIKQRSASFQDIQNRRKHMNSRRNDVSILFGFLCYFSLFLLYIIITETGESDQNNRTFGHYKRPVDHNV